MGGPEDGGAWVLSSVHCIADLLVILLPPQCLKFRTDQQADLKRVEALNNTFFRLMARGPDAGEGVLLKGIKKQTAMTSMQAPNSSFSDRWPANAPR